MTRVHISFQTADFDASTRFYAELFGAGPDKLRDDYARFQPADVPITLSVMPGQPQPTEGHFGVKLATADAVRAAHARLEGAGLVRSTEEATTCCYAVQDKIWLADPDGRAWEVYAVTDELGLTRQSSDGTCCAPGSDPSAASCCG